jgi:cobalt-zinc-cadmium efflux system membrane fusion protein
MLVAAIAVAVVTGVLLFRLMPVWGQSPASDEHMARLVSGAQGNPAMPFETVGVKIFQTETLADGYVAANGGWTSSAASTMTAQGMPVLQGQSADLIQAEGDLATSHAQFVAANANEQRQHALYQADGASLKDWQQAQVDAATAASGLSAARNKLRLLGKSDRAILALERMGGSSVPRIFSVGDSSLVWLVADIREADVGHVHLGDKVDVTLPAAGGKKLTATITYIDSAIDPISHRLAVAAAFRNSDHALSPNMLAAFDILDRDAVEAPAVPQSAVIYEGDQARVWRADAHGNVSRRLVQVGRIRDGYAEIIKGLSAGDRIVAGGALFLDQASTGD